MSLESGCWLFLAGAYPTGGRIVTFASEKLRQEGLTEINEIANNVNEVMQRMRTARRLDGMVLLRKYQEEKEAREKAETELAALRASVEETKSQAELLHAEYERIQKYRNLLPAMDEGDDFGHGNDDDDEADPEAPL